MSEEKDMVEETENKENSEEAVATKVAAPPDDLNDDNDFYEEERVVLPKRELHVTKGRGKKGRVLSKNPDRMNPNDPDQTDYIKHGSAIHAQMLGLVPMSKETKRIRKEKGMQELDWELEDITKYGVSATGRYLETVLLQKISELNTLPTEVQSDYPYDAGYAKPIWMPKDGVDAQGNPVMQTTKGIV